MVKIECAEYFEASTLLELQHQALSYAEKTAEYSSDRELQFFIRKFMRAERIQRYDLGFSGVSSFLNTYSHGDFTIDRFSLDAELRDSDSSVAHRPHLRLTQHLKSPDEIIHNEIIYVERPSRLFFRLGRTEENRVFNYATFLGDKDSYEFLSKEYFQEHRDEMHSKMSTYFKKYEN